MYSLFDFPLTWMSNYEMNEFVTWHEIVFNQLKSNDIIVIYTANVLTAAFQCTLSK